MNGRRFDRAMGVSCCAAGVLLLFSCCTLAAQSPAGTVAPPASAATVRPCSANPVLSTVGAKKSSSDRKHSSPSESAPACLEIKGQAIEVQEFLQNTSRRQIWCMSDNHASEDTWSCVRYFDAEQFARFADTKVLVEQVTFTDGKAAIMVRTVDLGDGFVRVQASAQFQGQGQSTDKATPQPASVWPLRSKGVLEQELLQALESGYKPLG